MVFFKLRRSLPKLVQARPALKTTERAPTLPTDRHFLFLSDLCFSTFSESKSLLQKLANLWLVTKITTKNNYRNHQKFLVVPSYLTDKHLKYPKSILFSMFFEHFHTSSKSVIQCNYPQSKIPIINGKEFSRNPLVAFRSRFRSFTFNLISTILHQKKSVK